MKLKGLKFKAQHPDIGGCQAVIEFDNGYGASVVSGGIAYTSERLPYELAVLKDGEICYDTPVTDDVLGYQTSDSVASLLNQIASLPKEVA